MFVKPYKNYYTRFVAGKMFVKPYKNYYTRVKEDEKPKYGKAVSKGMFTLAFTFLINGTLALFREKLGTSLILVAVLLVGLIVSTALFYSAQKRYNDGVL